MTREQLNRYRRHLEQRVVAIRETLNPESQSKFRDESKTDDNHVLVGQRSLGLLAIDRNLEILEEIHAALGRMDQDEYGICQICEEPIHPKRLDAIPWTRRCILCQAAADNGEPASPGRRRPKLAA
jgi:DnaK suppressor protein